MDVLVSVNSIQVSLYMGILLLPMVVLYFWPQAIIPPQPPKAFGVIKVFSLSSTSQLIHRRLQTCVRGCFVFIPQEELLEDFI
ncbi:uncharacterized protein LOC128577277 isoform X4 [Nycticebus coucang]|uniref:uncharacterized protein LOC128577277 isoform X4 n=1 Tax=Nycticebus coucang TaxID=9470 RepID=UPI00234C88AD|nr:uncharacterized protein LOC128577277 isoform X4 [Nycticebus coucang]